MKRTVFTGIILIAMIALTAFSVTAFGFHNPKHGSGLVLCTAGLWLLFGLAVLLLRKVPIRPAIVLVVGLRFAIPSGAIAKEAAIAPAATAE